jgi:hypothetical protein
MKKYISKITVFFLIPTLSLAAVLCCNMGLKPAEASVVKVKKLPSCHAQEETSPAPEQRDCSCCKEKKLQADLPNKVSVDTPQGVVSFLPLSILPQQILSPKDQFTFASLDGPPGPSSDIPRYISFHNFRI